jgi:hypothetical protein
MKCLAGVEFPNGKPCPKCKAALGDVCWPGINAELLEAVRLRQENERLQAERDHWLALVSRADVAQFPFAPHPPAVRAPIENKWDGQS